jgi:protein-tyrosine-phosphatase/predicted ATP-grasp superfamily ATP-dependent carboligase
MALMSDTSMARMKVLVLDAESAAGLETVQSLGKHGCTVHTAAFQAGQRFRSSRFVRRHFVLGTSIDEAIHDLVSLFEAEKYGLVVPATEVSLLAMLSPEIPDNLYRRAALAPRSSVQTALDKQEVWELAQRIGVRVPTSELVCFSSSPPDTFPVVLKPVHSKRNAHGVVKEFGVTIVRDLTQWRTALTTTYQDIPVQQQQYVPGKGLGLEMLFQHGKPQWVFLHERVHELPLTGGGSSYRKSLALRDDLVQSATLLLSALEWHGVAMVEFKVAPSGEAYLMEINPRLWGSLALAIDCGVDFPVGLLRLATGQPIPPQPKYRIGYYTRNLYRDIEWLKTNWKADHSDPLLLTKPIVPSILGWLRPLIGKESWDFFCWSDLRVVLVEVKTLISEHWRRVANVVRRRTRRLYLRYIQQPLMIRRLRGRQINKVLILCYGNICRSPLAAALAMRRFPHVSFTSAGFYPTVDRSCPDFVLSAGQRLGVDLTEHRSQCVDAEMIAEAGLIVIMDIRNYELLKEAFPGALEKTLFLGMLLLGPQLEIKDPYDHPESMPATALELDCAIERMWK